jgi:hypothetical protein
MLAVNVNLSGGYLRAQGNGILGVMDETGKKNVEFRKCERNHNKYNQ